MSMTDPVADMLTRIRNAVMRRHESVVMPASRLKGEIARLLKEEGFIRQYKLVTDGPRTSLKIELKYLNEDEPTAQALVGAAHSDGRLEDCLLTLAGSTVATLHHRDIRPG